MFECKILGNTPSCLKLEMGGLNTMAATEMQPMLDELLQEIDRPVLVDVTRLEYISSSGLRHFMAIRKKAAANGQHVTIQGMSKSIICLPTAIIPAVSCRRASAVPCSGK